MQHAHVHDKHRGPLSRGEQPSGSRYEVWWTEPDPRTAKTITKRKRFAKEVHAQAHADDLNSKFRGGVAAPTLDGSTCSPSSASPADGHSRWSRTTGGREILLLR